MKHVKSSAESYFLVVILVDSQITKKDNAKSLRFAIDLESVEREK